MFKSRAAARKACLLAGVDSTLPLTTKAVNRGYKPDPIIKCKTCSAIGTTIEHREQCTGSIKSITDDKTMKKLTMGAAYGKLDKA